MPTRPPRPGLDIIELTEWDDGAYAFAWAETEYRVKLEYGAWRLERFDGAECEAVLCASLGEAMGRAMEWGEWVEV